MRKISSLSNKSNNITKIAIIYFFSALYFYTPIVTLYCRHRGLNFLQINSLWAIIVGTMFFTEVPTGIIADKIGRKKSINISLALQLLGEVMFIFANAYWIFVLISIIAGLGFTFASGCVEALIYDSLKEEKKEREMKKAMGIKGASSQLAFIIAPIAGGFIASNLEISEFILAIILTAISVAMALFVSFSLKEPSITYRHTEGNPLVLLTDGIKLIKENKSLQRIMLLSLITTPFVNYLINLYQPYFLMANVSGVWLGIAFSIGSAIALLGERYAYLIEKYLGVKKSVLLATGLPGILYLLMALVFHPIFSVVIFCLLYGSTGMKRPLFSDYQNIHITSKNRATILSLISMFSGMYVSLMGLIIGRIGDYSIPYAFVFMGSIVLIGSVFLRIDESFIKSRID